MRLIHRGLLYESVIIQWYKIVVRPCMAAVYIIYILVGQLTLISG